jgi:hypothetical protein
MGDLVSGFGGVVVGDAIERSSPAFWGAEKLINLPPHTLRELKPVVVTHQEGAIHRMGTVWRTAFGFGHAILSFFDRASIFSGDLGAPTAPASRSASPKGRTGCNSFLFVDWIEWGP